MMLKLFLKPNCIVFQSLNYDMMNHLQDLYNLDFIIKNDVYSVAGDPYYLYKLMYKLARDFDIEVN